MNQTDALIEQLARRGGQATGNKRLAFALPLLAAALAGALSLLILLGAPFAAAASTSMAPLLGKWVFCLSLTAAALAALYTLAHPGRRSDMPLLIALVPLAVLTMLGALEFTGGLGRFPGATWRTCLAAMTMIGSLGFVAAIYATRLLAPVKLRRAGFAAGLFGGGLAATVYAPFCPEHGTVYLLVFYGGPIMALAAFGWLTGPRLLRW